MGQSSIPDAAQVDLRTLTTSGGCACKMPAGRLESVLSDVDAHLTHVLGAQPLVREDAARFELHQGGVLLSSVDFGTPVAASGSKWGRIATMNALSDIYATGGVPKFALSILGWPANQSVEAAAEVLRGAVEALQEEGVQLLGGHTISSVEPIFGLSVVGTQTGTAAFALSAAEPGDDLVLTKPLGTGVVLAGAKAGLANPEDVERAEDVMCKSNRLAARIGEKFDARAATDVSGYGLVGHALAIAKASTVTVAIEASRVPVVEGAREIAMQGVYPNLAEKSYFEFTDVAWDDRVSMVERMILCDPQTSGGLLLSVDPGKSQSFIRDLAEDGIAATRVGSVHVLQGDPLIVVP